MTRGDGVELVWPGKYDADGHRSPIASRAAPLRVDALYPANAPSQGSATWNDRLVLGDNLAVLQTLVREHPQTADLVYIDPPFATGGVFSVSTRVGEGVGRRPPPEVHAPAYSDRWEGGTAGFLAMLDPRLRLVRELMAPHASLYIHVDPTVGHAVKLLADEIFGLGSFQREIVWRIGWVSGFKTTARNWIRNHDLIFFYVKDPKRFTFNKHHVPYPEGYRRRDGALPKGKGMPIDDVWNASPAELELRGRDSLDSIQIKSFSTEKSGYATQKNTSLLRRIVQASSNPGDLVVDVFCGAGTTAVVAAQLGRRYIACDASAPAVHIATKRLLEQERQFPLRVQSIDAWAGDRPLPDIASANVAAQIQLPLEGERAGPDAAVHRAMLLEHHGAHPVDESGASDLLHGRIGKDFVHVALPDAAVGERELSAVLECARDHGAKGLHVIADAFELPLKRASIEDIDLLLLRVGREISDARCRARTDAALFELPQVELALESTAAGELAVAVLDYAVPHPKRLDMAVREAVRSPADFIDMWSVQWEADTAVYVPDLVRFRTHNVRTLDLRAGPHTLAGKGPSRVRIRLRDILHQEVDIVLELRRRGRAWSVASAVQR
jgi:adenine-specific DNA-methyltransferase